MTNALHQLLSSFDALSDAEKYAAAREVLRRVQEVGPAELADEALVAAANEVFHGLDRREAADGAGKTTWRKPT